MGGGLVTPATMARLHLALVARAVRNQVSRVALAQDDEGFFVSRLLDEAMTGEVAT
jgi:hypothetical protein